MAKEHAADHAAVVAIPEDDREYRVVVGQSLIGRGGGARGSDADGDSADAQQQQHDSSENSLMMVALRQQQQPAKKKLKTAAGSTPAASSSSKQHDDASEMCVSFRYEFQPASVDKSMPGLVTVDESNGLQVLMGNSTGAPGGILFKGKAVENKEIDCLLIFDGTCFRLEKCPFSYTQLRHARAPPPTRRQVKVVPDATGSAAAATASSSSSATVMSSTAADAASATESPATAPSTRMTTAGRGRGRGRGRGSGRSVAAPKAKVPRATKANTIGTSPTRQSRQS